MPTGSGRGSPAAAATLGGLLLFALGVCYGFRRAAGSRRGKVNPKKGRLSLRVEPKVGERQASPSMSEFGESESLAEASMSTMGERSTVPMVRHKKSFSAPPTPHSPKGGSALPTKSAWPLQLKRHDSAGSDKSVGEAVSGSGKRLSARLHEAKDRVSGRQRDPSERLELRVSEGEQMSARELEEQYGSIAPSEMQLASAMQRELSQSDEADSELSEGAAVPQGRPRTASLEVGERVSGSV